VIVGGPSGSGIDTPDWLTGLAKSLGLDDRVRFVPPVDRGTIAEYYRAADLTVVPSYNESFGLVALEAQACGTPVVAASVGGLRVAVADGRSGVLVADHHPQTWARALADLLADPVRLGVLADGAVEHAVRFGWDRTAQAMLDVYTGAVDDHRARLLGEATAALAAGAGR